MKKIYNEVRRFEGKIIEFAKYLVEKGIYATEASAKDALRHNTRAIPEVDATYAEWKPGRLRTRDMEKHNNKLKEVFETIRVHTAKAEYNSIVEVLEEALKEVTLAIKNKDLGRLPEVKRLIGEALYGSK